MSGMTLGQAAYEARFAARAARLGYAHGIGHFHRPWDELSAGDRADEEAGAHSAVDARLAAMAAVADGGTVVVAFREPLTRWEGAELHERWAKLGPKTARLVILDDVAAIAAQQP